MRGVGRRAQYVSCFSSASVVRDGGPSAVEDAMRHRRVAPRCHRCGVCYGSCVWNVRASSLQSPASPGARGKRKKKKKRNSLVSSFSVTRFYSRFTFVVCLPARSADAHRPQPTNQPTGLLVLLSVATFPFTILPRPRYLSLLRFFTFLPLQRPDSLLFVTSNQSFLALGDEIAWFHASVRFTCHVLPLSFLHTCISRASHFNQLQQPTNSPVFCFLSSNTTILFSNFCFTRRHFDTFESNGALTHVTRNRIRNVRFARWSVSFKIELR